MRKAAPISPSSLTVPASPVMSWAEGAALLCIMQTPMPGSRLSLAGAGKISGHFLHFARPSALGSVEPRGLRLGATRNTSADTSRARADFLQCLLFHAMEIPVPPSFVVILQFETVACTFTELRAFANSNTACDNREIASIFCGMVFPVATVTLSKFLILFFIVFLSARMPGFQSVRCVLVSYIERKSQPFQSN